MNYIYVVYGESGEYDSCIIWDVAAFIKPEHANNFLDKINEWLTNNRKKKKKMSIR